MVFKNIMVIDDSPFDRLIAKKIIEHAKFTGNVILLNSAFDAIDHLKLRNDSSDLQELIFLDISMPDMDGFGFLKKFESFPVAIRQKYKIVMLSSTMDPAELEKAKKSHCVDDFISKPLTLEKLLACIDSHSSALFK